MALEVAPAVALEAPVAVRVEAAAVAVAGAAVNLLRILNLMTAIVLPCTQRVLMVTVSSRGVLNMIKYKPT